METSHILVLILLILSVLINLYMLYKKSSEDFATSKKPKPVKP